MTNGDLFNDKRFSVFTIILAAILSSGGASVGSSYFRVDKFGRSEFIKEFEAHKTEVRIETEAQFRTHKLEEEYERRLLEARLPPDEWQRSITKMERHLSRKDGFEPYQR